MNKFGRTKMMSLNGQNTKQLDRQELYTGIRGCILQIFYARN